MKRSIAVAVLSLIACLCSAEAEQAMFAVRLGPRIVVKPAPREYGHGWDCRWSAIAAEKTQLILGTLGFNIPLRGSVMGDVMAEQDLRYMGRFDPATLPPVGKMQGATHYLYVRARMNSGWDEFPNLHLSRRSVGGGQYYAVAEVSGYLVDTATNTMVWPNYGAISSVIGKATQLNLSYTDYRNGRRFRYNPRPNRQGMEHQALHEGVNKFARIFTASFRP